MCAAPFLLALCVLGGSEAEVEQIPTVIRGRIENEKRRYFDRARKQKPFLPVDKNGPTSTVSQPPNRRLKRMNAVPELPRFTREETIPTTTATLDLSEEKQKVEMEERKREQERARNDDEQMIKKIEERMKELHVGRKQKEEEMKKKEEELKEQEQARRDDEQKRKEEQLREQERQQKKEEEMKRKEEEVREQERQKKEEEEMKRKEEELKEQEQARRDDEQKRKEEEVREQERQKKEEEEQKEPEEEPKTKTARFKIDSVIPTTLSAKGGEKVELEMNETVIGPVFCKFNNEVVAGRHLDGRKIACNSPSMKEGEVYLSVSIDRVKWCREVLLTVVADDSDLPWYVVAIGGVAIIGVSFMIIRTLCWKRNVPKRKSSRKKVPISDPLQIKQHSNERKERLHRRRPQEDML